MPAYRSSGNMSTQTLCTILVLFGYLAAQTSFALQLEKKVQENGPKLESLVENPSSSQNSDKSAIMPSKLPANHRAASGSQRAASIAEAPPMNLIPVDKPLTWSSSKPRSQSVMFADDPTLYSPSDSPFLAAAATDPQDSPAAVISSSNSKISATSSKFEPPTSGSVLFPDSPSQNELVAQEELGTNSVASSQQLENQEDFSSQRQNSATDSSTWSEQVGPETSSDHQQQEQPEQQREFMDEPRQHQLSGAPTSGPDSSPLERRFGLLKKVAGSAASMMMMNNQQPAAYSYPMAGVALPLGGQLAQAPPASASYQLNDCERCVTAIGGGLSNGQQLQLPYPQQTGSYQLAQLQDSSSSGDPPTSNVALPSPMSVTTSTNGMAQQQPGPIGPMPMMGPFGMVGPLKSKLLMKFPFLIKSHKHQQLQQQHHHNHNQQQHPFLQHMMMMSGDQHAGLSPLQYGTQFPVVQSQPLSGLPLGLAFLGAAGQAPSSGFHEYQHQPSGPATWRAQPLSAPIFLRPALNQINDLSNPNANQLGQTTTTTAYHCIQAPGSLLSPNGPSSSSNFQGLPYYASSLNQQQQEGAASNIFAALPASGGLTTNSQSATKTGSGNFGELNGSTAGTKHQQAQQYSQANY